jgi:hypothetical protein
MSKVFIVSYDLSDPGRDYNELIRRIKSYGGWAKLGGSAYLVATDKTAVEIRDHLKVALDSDDKIFVGSCPAPSAWRGLGDDVSQWIHKHQGAG